MDLARIATCLERRPLGFELGLRHHVPVHEPYWESHEGLEIALHVSGSGVVDLGDGATNAFGPGCIEVYAPRMRHRQVMARGGDDCFVRAAPMPELEAVLTGNLFMPRPPDALAEHDLRALSDAPTRPTRIQLAEFGHRMTALLLRLLSHAETRPAGARLLPPAPRPGKVLAREAQRYIDDHVATIDRIEEIADALGISHDRLRHVFTRESGRSLVRALMEARVVRASDLLTTTDLPLAAVASCCGLHSESYLCRVFRQVRGCSPASLRARA